MFFCESVQGSFYAHCIFVHVLSVRLYNLMNNWVEEVAHLFLSVLSCPQLLPAWMPQVTKHQHGVDNPFPLFHVLTEGLQCHLWVKIFSKSSVYETLLKSWCSAFPLCLTIKLNCSLNVISFKLFELLNK